MKYLSIALLLLSVPAGAASNQGGILDNIFGVPTELPPNAIANVDDPDDETQMYDVNDLVRDRVVLGASGLRSESTLLEVQKIVDLLDEIMNGRARGLDSISALPSGHLLVKGHRAAHEYTQDFLEAQRSGPSSIAVNFHLFEVPAGYLKEIGVEGNSALFEDKAEITKLMDKLGKSDKVNILTAPNLVMRPRESAQISTTKQVAYVKDYVLQIVAPGNTEICDPVIDTVEEGLILDVRAVPVPGGVVQFDVDVNYALLQRPIPTLKIRVHAGDGAEVTISLPVVDSINLHSVLALPPGSMALISAASPVADRDFIVIINYYEIPGMTSPRVNKLFKSMRDGTYEHRWFPPLKWEDIPALLNLSSSERLLTDFPTNPLSSQGMTSCPEGVVALWLIEGIFERGNLPSLNAILLQDGSKLSLTDAISTEQQLKLLKKASTAYSAWWTIASRSRQNTGDALTGLTSALKDTGIRWY